MMHQPLAGLRGQAADIAIQAEQLVYTKKRMAELTAQHTGQTVEKIQADAERDRWFTAEEAVDLRPGRQGHPPPRPDQLTRARLALRQRDGQRRAALTSPLSRRPAGDGRRSRVGQGMSSSR